jgi:hypothetical protein
MTKQEIYIYLYGVMFFAKWDYTSLAYHWFAKTKDKQRILRDW